MLILTQPLTESMRSISCLLAASLDTQINPYEHSERPMCIETTHASSWTSDLMPYSGTGPVSRLGSKVFCCFGARDILLSLTPFLHMLLRCCNALDHVRPCSQSTIMLTYEASALCEVVATSIGKAQVICLTSQPLSQEVFVVTDKEHFDHSLLGRACKVR